MKKKILIMIDDLARGGAETLLVGVLPELNEKYNLVLVTLTENCDFLKEEISVPKHYKLGFTGKFTFVSCMLSLRKIIQSEQPDLIHTHLFYSSLLAKFACGNSIPLLFTIHSMMSKDIFDISKIFKWLEKISIKKNHAVLAVSEEVLTDYKNTITHCKTGFVLKNYIPDFFLDIVPKRVEVNKEKVFKMVAVGNIKAIKNYDYILESLKLLSAYHISLDIYGKDQGGLLPELTEKVRIHRLPVRFMGPASNIIEVLPQYDAYVLCSKFEGFGLAAIEAAAVGLPLLLSDLPVLREITFNNALYFDISSPDSFAKLMVNILNEAIHLQSYSDKGIQMVKANYTKEKYLEGLSEIYHQWAGV